MQPFKFRRSYAKPNGQLVVNVDEARQLFAEAQLEHPFMCQLMEAMKLRGWRVYHTYDSRRSEPGFPDVVGIRGDRLLAVETKRVGKQPTPEQLAWLADFAGVKTVQAVAAWPTDWDALEALIQ